MLSEIKSINKFGVFADYNPERSLQFLKFNLFYGWNGSGKSTLSRVFDSMTGQPSPAFPNGDFKITSDNKVFTKVNVGESSLKVAVFNQDFIKKNLDFDTHKAKSILYISEEKIEEKQKLEEKTEKLQDLSKAFATKGKEIETLREEISSELTRLAKNIKSSFGLIQTSNTKFLNYDKRKLEAFITSNSTKIGLQSILDEEALEKTRLSAQSSQKSEVSLIENSIDKQSAITCLEDSKKNVEISVVASRIQKLIDDENLNKWVGTGLQLYKVNKNDKCDFCGETISATRIKDLEAHFSDEYQSTVDALSKSLNSLKDFDSKLAIALPDSGDFYAELQDKIKKDKTNIESSIKNISTILSSIQVAVKEKKDNPFKVIVFGENDFEAQYDALDEHILSFNNTVNEHNKKTGDFQKSVSDANESLELHFVCQQLQNSSLDSKKKTLDSADDETKKIKIDRDLIAAEVKQLEAQLVNAAIAADVFNAELNRFIGHSDIAVEFKKELGGYQFTRGGQKELAGNLSEGEKTALAFIYFITKLKESGNAIENTIVVLDDPISSFDSNHLHHSFGFIRHHLGECKQLIILTHNFDFFKMIRDWMKKKNEDKEPPKYKSKFFLVQSIGGEIRKSEVVELPELLLSYESEYHFLFQKLLTYQGKENLEFEQSHFIGNASRKILEAFLAFKYPSYKADFAGLLGKACGQDKNQFHKIYSFINKYSHSKSLEVFSVSSDSVFAESKNIVEDVLGLIRKMDDSHYSEMEKVCS